MTALTIPRHQRDGCLYQFTPDARAALMHQGCASRAITLARISQDPDLKATTRQFYRSMARSNAALARRYFAQWMEARR